MMLVTWVMELYLNQLGELRDSARMSGYEGMQDEFRKFLNQSKVKVCHIFLSFFVINLILFLVSIFIFLNQSNVNPLTTNDE